MYRDLLSPTRIGSVELRNRIAMAPMGVEIAEADGKVREPLVRYYEERARGGVGLIITENTAAMYPRGANSAHEIAVSDEAYLPGLSELTAAVHRHGTKIAIQLAHHGKVGRLDTVQGREIWMPSLPRGHAGPTGPLDLTREELGLMAKAAGGGKPTIREMTTEDLRELTAGFASAAALAKRAGFDAVELHAAHGYIFSEFLSPAWNLRADEYGGPVENRARLLCEVLRACKDRVGTDFPVWCRLDAVEFGTPDGITLEDAKRTAELADAAGADAISVSAYANPLGAGFTDGPIVHEPGRYASFAAEIKARVSVPVIVAGRIEPEVGDRLIREGGADVIAMGRKLLADPELPAKLAADREHHVRPCIYCYVCVAQPFFDRRVKCAVNPLLAREAELADLLREPTSEPRKVLVVGGGPAGMEAARVAALRGHTVTLCEKGAQLGGTLRFAALPYEPNERLLRWFEAQLQALPVEIRLNSEVSDATVREIAPDVVIAAVGATRARPEIPGIDSAHVLDGDDLRDLLTGAAGSRGAPALSLFARVAIGVGRLLGITRDPALLRTASKLYMPVGRRVAVVGGGLVGIEFAEFLAERGREVAVLDEAAVMAPEMAHPRRWRVLHELRERGVRLVGGAEILEIGSSAVRFRADGGEHEVAADTVVVATGLEANPAAIERIRAGGVSVIPIGDAKGVGYIEGAIHDGFRAALEL